MFGRKRERPDEEREIINAARTKGYEVRRSNYASTLTLAQIHGYRGFIDSVIPDLQLVSPATAVEMQAHFDME